MAGHGRGRGGEGRRRRFGRTWWSERWLAVIAEIGLGARLPRGRALARSGGIDTLEVASGEVSAGISGPRQEFHRVRIAMEPIPPASWDTLQEILSRRALFAARLLAGEMPQQIEEAFAEAGLSLFPAQASELEVECTCSDPVRPCPHCAAVFYLMAERFDEDPFLLLLFRGRGRQELLEAMKLAWASAAAPPAAEGPDGASPGGPESGEPGGPEPAAPSRGGPETPIGEPAAEPPPAAADVLEGFWDLRASLDPLDPRIMPPPIPEAVLRRIGPPPSAAPDSSAEAALRHAYQVASAWALRLAAKEDAENG